MPKLRIGNDIVRKIIKLRETGHSLPEIRHITGIGNSTAFKYIKNVRVLPQYESLLRAKQGGSIARSKRKWAEASKEARRLVECITERERLLILACLYWGEGNKRNVNSLRLVNTDPRLVKKYIEFLKSIYQIDDNKLKFGLQVLGDMDGKKVLNFWLKTLNVDKKQFQKIVYIKKRGEGTYKHSAKYGVLIVYFNNRKLRDIICHAIEKL